MRAMVLRAPREIVSGDVPRPEANSRDVLVRVTNSGICGTDYKIYSGAIPVSYPRVMGHEMAGEVVDAGVERASAAATASSSTRSCIAARASIAGSARRTSARRAF